MELPIKDTLSCNNKKKHKAQTIRHISFLIRIVPSFFWVFIITSFLVLIWISKCYCFWIDLDITPWLWLATKVHKVFGYRWKQSNEPLLQNMESCKSGYEIKYEAVYPNPSKLLSRYLYIRSCWVGICSSFSY